VREIVNAVFYLARSGCAWRMLPHDYPPWKTVSYYFYTWRDAGVWERLHHIQGLRPPAQAVDRRADDRLVRPVPAAREGLRAQPGQQRGVDLHRHDPPHEPPAGARPRSRQPPAPTAAPPGGTRYAANLDALSDVGGRRVSGSPPTGN
jgi:hypothetical protein